MNLVEELFASLKNEQNKELILPDALTFPALDLERFELDIKLEEQAQVNGEKDFPTTESKEFDYTQQQIIEYTLRTIRPFQASYTEAIAAYNARLASLDPLGFDARIRGLAAKKKADLKMIASQVSGEIYLQENYLKEREEEYRKFKEKHGNPADPTSIMTIQAKILIIFLLVMLEGSLNSFFLGDYMRGGLLEGMAYAIAIPLLSIVFFGSMAGISLRKLTYATPVKKVIFLLAIIISTAGSLALTLMLAAMRISGEASDEYEKIFMEVWLSLLKFDPIYSINLSAILLVSLGFAFYIIAMFDIKSMDHPIPGFLDSYKTREKAHQDYSKKMEDSNRRLSEVANASDEISTAFHRLQTWQMEYQNIIINRRQLADKFGAYIKLIEAQVNNLISKYRQINVQHRKTPAPLYFGSKWVYPEMVMEPTESSELIKDFQSKMQKVYENIDNIQKELEHEVKDLAGVIAPVRKALGKP
jgi:hypothetical protein